METAEYRKLVNDIDSKRAVLEVLSRVHTESGHRLPRQFQFYRAGLQMPQQFFGPQDVFDAYRGLIGLLKDHYAHRDDADIANWMSRLDAVLKQIEKKELEIAKQKYIAKHKRKRSKKKKPQMRRK